VSSSANPRDDLNVPTPLARAAAISWRLLAVAAAVIAIALLAARLRVVLVPAAVAVLAACALWPLTRRLRSLGAPNAVAALAPVIGMLGLIVLVVSLLAPRAANEAGDLDVGVSGGVDIVQGWLTDGPLNLSNAQVERFLDQAEREIRSARSRIAGGAVGGALIAMEVLAGIVLTVVLLFFFLKDGDRMWRSVRSLLPPGRRTMWDGIVTDVRDVLAGFIRGTTLVALVDAVGIAVGLLLLGVPLVVPLAVLTFVGGFVPIIGATVAGFVAIMVALVSNGFITALAVLGVVVAVQQLEGNVLQPFVVGRAVNLHPVVVLLAVSVGAVLWGVAGALLAVPIAAALSTVLSALHQEAAS
jgi:putative heme transporter